jgi:hypothetical protein
MEHAEAHEQLADLALEPGRLAKLETDDDPEVMALRAHVATCERCAADLAGWRRTWAAVRIARFPARAGDGTGSDPDAPTPLKAPDRLRARTLAAIRSEGGGAPEVSGPPAPASIATLASRAATSRRERWTRVLAAAAVIVAVVASGFALWSQAGLNQARSESSELASVTATLDRILTASPHWVTPLRAADGAPGGTLAWSTTDLVVLVSGLAEPGSGQAYRCWVAQSGGRTVLGELSFNGSTAYWAGSMTGWTADFVPGAQFGVSLYAGEGSPAPPVLVATL